MSARCPLRSPVAWVLAACLIAAGLTAGSAAARTLEQVRALGVISMCANPDALPYSSDKPDAPGFQVEIGRALAQGLGVQLKVEWVVPRRRVAEVNCDMLLDSVNDPQLYGGRRLLSMPYQRSGIALALGPAAQGMSGLRDLNAQHRVGVMVGSLASVVLGKQGVRTSPYAFQADLLEAVEKGLLSGAAVSAQTLGYYLKQHPEANIRAVSLFETEPQLAWTVSVGLRNADPALLDEMNRIIASILADGTISGIYARYGVEHHTP
jgi:polar amino acid transport system substrate-binding protein